MLRFDSDYMRGAAPEVMKRLVETNMEQTVGYGDDEYTASARRLILEACGLSEGDVQFLEGGTQTNSTVLDGILGTCEGVIATDTSHIAVHEAGAIEAWGHKVLTLPHTEGRLPAQALEQWLTDFFADDTYTHMVIPGAVYVTQPTEYGTLYSLAQLEEIKSVCRKFGLKLYLDGARLAYALGAEGNDVTLPDIARLCDAFYIGGTKAGLLFGEAVVTPDPRLIPHFTTLIKRHGALTAKGRVLGVQFETLFADGLYTRLGRSAVECAMKLRKGFNDAGLPSYIDSPTNQQFFLLTAPQIERLRRIATFELWGPMRPGMTPVRFVTDWATTPDDIEALLKCLAE